MIFLNPYSLYSLVSNSHHSTSLFSLAMLSPPYLVLFWFSSLCRYSLSPYYFIIFLRYSLLLVTFTILLFFFSGAILSRYCLDITFRWSFLLLSLAIISLYLFFLAPLAIFSCSAPANLSLVIRVILVYVTFPYYHFYLLSLITMFRYSFSPFFLTIVSAILSCYTFSLSFLVPFLAIFSYYSLTLFFSIYPLSLFSYAILSFYYLPTFFFYSLLLLSLKDECSIKCKILLLMSG